MVYEKCNELVGYLESMMADGVQLVHGGHLLSWNDTNLPDIIQEMKKRQSKKEALVYQSGDLLENKLSGQRASVIRDDGKFVHLIPVDNVIVYPKESLESHYTKVKK
jgi:hypothetical protein